LRPETFPATERRRARQQEESTVKLSPRRVISVAVLAAATLVLAACGNDAPEAASTPETTASETPAAVDQGDIRFAQSMIPHHEQAIMMADMALQEAQSDDVRALASRIKAAQDPEIATMRGWLDDWGADDPDSMAMNGDAGDHAGMPGMMTDENLDTLSGMHGADFDTMWLQMMIEHHEGAVDMANDVLATTSNPEVEALASAIVEGQTAEIGEMRGLLAG
jgi:uncharacterized protein (DUF305 family)